MSTQSVRVQFKNTAAERMTGSWRGFSSEGTKTKASVASLHFRSRRLDARLAKKQMTDAPAEVFASRFESRILSDKGF